MGREASVAPKERVEILFKPATGDAQREVELPLRLMVMGDFKGYKDTRKMEDREPVSIDKDNFNSVLKEQEVKLDFSVKDTISAEEDAVINVQMDIENINDFNPDSIVEKIPKLKDLLEKRNAFLALRGPLVNKVPFQKMLTEAMSDEESKQKLMKELGIEEKDEK
jgi:type VI secretion system protein ImpB